MYQRTLFVTLLMAIAVIARLLPHPPNFTPVAALALFGGASLSDKRLAFCLPLIAMAISDIFLGWHATLPVVYVCLALNVLLGRWAGSGLQLARLVPATLGGSILFFLVTNGAVWLNSDQHSWESLVTCFTLAIPFFQNSLAGDLSYGCLLFGTLAVAQARFPSLQPQPVRFAN